MRDQYSGDVSDLFKFSLLRALAAGDRTIGVAWYYNPKIDRLQDGRHREFCDEPKWVTLDEGVWSALRDLKERSVSALERLAIWPANTRFHRTPVPAATDRVAWVAHMTATLGRANLILLDPDNGVGNATEQHATVEEIAALRKEGRAIVLIKFPPRSEKHQQHIQGYHRSLLINAGATSVTTIQTCVSVIMRNKNGIVQAVPRVRLFTLIDADAQLIGRAEDFVGKLRRIERCTAEVVHGLRSMIGSSEKPQGSVLQLMGILERALRAITPDQSAPFYKQVELHAAKFSDVAGITDARRVRNMLAYGEVVPSTRILEAAEVLKKALADMGPHCPGRMQNAIREALEARSRTDRELPPQEGAISHPIRQTAPASTTRTEQKGAVANVCPECGHQFKGHGFDGIDAHWRARHETVMPYRQAWPLIKSGSYRRSSR